MSEGFSPAWLELREPYDARARSRELLGRLSRWRAGRGALRVLDLGAGTGSNLRCTAPALGGEQHWTLVEWDPALIAAGSARLRGADVGWSYRRLDLAADLEQLTDAPIDVITAAALIDLVSLAWLDRLVRVCGRTGAALYIVLTCDGRIRWEPNDSMDAAMAGWFGAHQHGDKGFGGALGPTAAESLRDQLQQVNTEPVLAGSDWVFGAADVAIQRELLRGYAAAACDHAPDRHAEILAWADRRRRTIANGRSSLRVGHRDLLMLPA